MPWARSFCVYRWRRVADVGRWGGGCGAFVSKMQACGGEMGQVSQKMVIFVRKLLIWLDNENREKHNNK